MCIFVNTFEVFGIIENKGSQKNHVKKYPRLSKYQFNDESTVKTFIPNLLKNFIGLLAKHYPSISGKWKWEALVSTLYFLERRTCQKLL